MTQRKARTTRDVSRDTTINVDLEEESQSSNKIYEQANGKSKHLPFGRRSNYAAEFKLEFRREECFSKCSVFLHFERCSYQPVTNSLSICDKCLGVCQAVIVSIVVSWWVPICTRLPCKGSIVDVGAGVQFRTWRPNKRLTDHVGDFPIL